MDKQGVNDADVAPSHAFFFCVCASFAHGFLNPKYSFDQKVLQSTPNPPIPMKSLFVMLILQFEACFFETLLANMKIREKTP